MKHNRVIKVISMLLAAIMICSFPLTAGAVIYDSTDTALIYVPDMSDISLYKTNKSSSAFSVDTETLVFKVGNEAFNSSAVDVLTGLAIASQESKTTSGASKAAAGIKMMFRDIGMDQYGNSEDKNVGALEYRRPVTENTTEDIYTENIDALVKYADGKIPTENIYVFNYDWRLDPTENADKLMDYIDFLMAKPALSRVALVSGGTGGNVVNSYLYAHMDHAKKYLRSCVFLDSDAMGSSLIGGIMSGDIIKGVTIKDGDDIFDIGTSIKESIDGKDVGDALARYIEQDPGGFFTTLLARYMGENNYAELWVKIGLVIFSQIAQKEELLNMIGEGYKSVLSSNKNSLYNMAIKDVMKYVPGFWALVPEEDYEDAIKMMFGSRAAMSKELLEKIENYRTVLANTQSTLEEAQSNGINTCIVAGYGLQILPVTARIDEQSDGLVATRYAGFGVKTGDIDSSIKTTTTCSYGNHSHMEPNKYCDASTCFLPENTWFICNHKNMEYTHETAVDFILWLALSDKQRTIYDSDAYPQYMRKAVLGGKVYAYTNATDVDLNDYYYGDLNVDGGISVEDARIALRYAVGLESEPSRILKKVGDVDGDGKISVKDARLILRYAIRLDNTFPVLQK